MSAPQGGGPAGSVVCRPVLEADLPALLAMVGALSAHHGDDAETDGAALARDLLGDRPWMLGILAEVDGRPTGYAALHPAGRLQRGERSLNLHHLWVEPDRRGRGVARALVAAAEARAAEEGCAALLVSVEAENAAARGLYAAAGFEDLGRPAPRLRKRLEAPEHGGPLVETSRLRLVPVGPALVPALRRYHAQNADHLRPWSPTRPEGWNEEAAWLARAARAEAARSVGAALPLAALPRDGGEVVALCSLSNVVRGAFQAAHLGFSVAARHEGRGLMREALEGLLAHAFGPMGLHRVMANHRPENGRSAALLARLGFEREGFARDYLLIDGAWRDHVLTSRVSPRPDAAP